MSKAAKHLGCDVITVHTFNMFIMRMKRGDGAERVERGRLWVRKEV